MFIIKYLEFGAVRVNPLAAGRNAMPVAVSQPGPVDRVLIRVVVLAIGLLAAGGCSNRSESAWRPMSGSWPAISHTDPNNPIEDPTAVLFVVYVETPPDIVDRMLRMARVTKDDVVCDLGCGDGRIVIAAARQYGCRAIGYDLDPLRVAEARRNAEREGVADLVTIEQKDVLTADLQGVTVVTLYMGEEMNARLIPQLRQLPAGARIVSHNYGLGAIPPDKAAIVRSRHSGDRHKIQFWRCPLPTDPRETWNRS